MSTRPTRTLRTAPAPGRPVATGAATRTRAWTVDELLGPPHPFQADLLEEDFQKQILRVCDALDLLAYHTHDSRRSRKGFPDLTIVGPSGFLFAELKKRDGRLTPEQRTWITALRAVGVEANIWRPADYPDVVRRLHALAQTPQETPCPTPQPTAPR